ncbi:MAG: hypothetical protein ACRES9_00245 [Gammaproteobacteria bacterium]
MASEKSDRGVLSVAMLLALVLAITAQLVTGFAMMAHFNWALLVAHVIGGLAAIVLTLAEWTWLAATRAGRHRLRGFVSVGGGPVAWSEAAFLVLATVTVVFGALLSAALYLGASLPFASLLDTHRALAIAVAALYLLHSTLSTVRARRRSGA